MKVLLLLDLLRSSGLLSERVTLQSVPILFIIPFLSSFCFERHLWVHLAVTTSRKYLAVQFQMELFLLCIVIWSDAQENRKVFQLFTFLCIFDNPHKYIKSKGNPHSTAKKCLDAHRPKKVCLNVLLNNVISLELDVYGFGPLDLLFLKSKQKTSDLWRVTCFSCCTLTFYTPCLVICSRKAAVLEVSIPVSRNIYHA